MRRNHVCTVVLMLSALSLCLVLSGCRSAGQQAQESPGTGNDTAVSFLGGDTEITVPDAVVKIGPDTFQEVQSPEKVTHITLSGKVEEISPDAFDRFPALRGVTVPEENRFFRSFTDEAWDNTYLCGTDRPLVFCFPGDGSSVHLSGDTAAPYFYGENVNVDFVCNGAVFTVAARTEEDGATRWYCSSMRRGAHMLVFQADEEFQGGNYRVSILRTSSDYIVFQRKGSFDAAYLLAPPGEHDELYGWSIGDSGVSLCLGENGELRYEKVDAAYADFDQYATCPPGIDGNAVYSEEGTAALTDGALVFTPEKQCTVSDYWSMRAH